MKWVNICCRIAEVASLKAGFHQLPVKYDPPLHQRIEIVLSHMKNCRHQMILNWQTLLSLVIEHFDPCSIKHVKQLWQNKILLFLCLLGVANLFAIRSFLLFLTPFCYMFLFRPYSSNHLISMMILLFRSNLPAQKC